MFQSPSKKYIYPNRTETVNKNINLTIKEDIPKNSAIPPHTPCNTLSADDLINLCDIDLPPICLRFYKILGVNMSNSFYYETIKKVSITELDLFYSLS